MSAQQIAHLLEILGVIGLNEPASTGAQHADGCINEIGLNKPSFVVALLRPGIGMVQVQHIHTACP